MEREYKKYQHIERFGTDDIQNIELGEAYVFPKIDGTNGTIWLSDGEVQAGSRSRLLSAKSDNDGFHKYATSDPRLKAYLHAHPDHRLFGEWLVPHSVKTYKDDAWRRFYIFDVAVDADQEFTYLPYNVYMPILEARGLDYIPPIAVIRNGSYEQFVNQLEKNVFLVQDCKGAGEGVVIKNYDYRNKYGRTAWAKIVTSECKEKHAKTMGPSDINGKKLVEEEIALKYVTEALVEKEYEKIRNEAGWKSQFIPRLLNTLYHCIVKVEFWNFVKECKNPTINNKRLVHFVFAKTKKLKLELF